MLRNVSETANRAFWYICNHYNGDYPISSRVLGERIGCSRYKALNALHELQDKGLVKRTSFGVPSYAGSGEYCDDWYDSAPPINGYILTDKGTASTEYRAAEEVRLASYRQLCEMEFDDEA